MFIHVHLPTTCTCSRTDIRIPLRIPAPGGSDGFFGSVLINIYCCVEAIALEEWC